MKKNKTLYYAFENILGLRKRPFLCPVFTGLKKKLDSRVLEKNLAFTTCSAICPPPGRLSSPLARIIGIMSEFFKNKITVVTGGSQGIGLQVVRQFVDLGAKVITCSRSKSKWKSQRNAYPDLDSVDYQCVDLSNDKELIIFFEYIQKTYKFIDIAVNNASSKTESVGNFAECDTSILQSTIHSDLWMPILCLRKEIPLMSNGGCIVNISSINGFLATPKAALYGAAKHGIEGITKSLAIEYIERGIRINSVAPGATMTPRWHKRFEEAADPKDYQEKVEEKIPIKRFAEPEEIANSVIWLCSEQSSYVVGHTLVVDGGLSHS